MTDQKCPYEQMNDFARNHCHFQWGMFQRRVQQDCSAEFLINGELKQSTDWSVFNDNRPLASASYLDSLSYALVFRWLKNVSVFRWVSFFSYYERIFELGYSTNSMRLWPNLSIKHFTNQWRLHNDWGSIFLIFIMFSGKTELLIDRKSPGSALVTIYCPLWT